jgi:hypothetical protein
MLFLDYKFTLSEHDITTQDLQAWNFDILAVFASAIIFVLYADSCLANRDD